MLVEHRTGGAITAKDVSNAALAMGGLVANLLTLCILFGLLGVRMAIAAPFSALAAGGAVFAVSAILSHRTRGAWRWYLALPPFLGSCALGFAADGVIATWLESAGWNWFLSGICGALVGAALVRRAIRHHLQ